jgi:hypothetical protein
MSGMNRERAAAAGEIVSNVVRQREAYLMAQKVMKELPNVSPDWQMADAPPDDSIEDIAYKQFEELRSVPFNFDALDDTETTDDEVDSYAYTEFSILAEVVPRVVKWHTLGKGSNGRHYKTIEPEQLLPYSLTVQTFEAVEQADDEPLEVLEAFGHNRPGVRLVLKRQVTLNRIAATEKLARTLDAEEIRDGMPRISKFDGLDEIEDALVRWAFYIQWYQEQGYGIMYDD